jgi:hypothetical protein
MLLLKIIENTPPYVWVALALICLRMARNLRTRWLTLQALLFPAAAFILVGIIGSSVQSTADALGWAVSACAGGPIGFFTAPHPLAVDRTKGRLQIRGSVLFATRLLVIFLIRYVLAVLMALHPDRHRELAFATSLFSGLFAGYYVGWSAFLLRAYRRAPKPDPQIPPATTASDDIVAPVP